MSTSFGWEGKGSFIPLAVNAGCAGKTTRFLENAPERLIRGVITTMRYTNPRLPLPLPLTKLEKVAIRDALPLEAALRASHTWLLKIPRLAAWTQNALAAQFG